MASTLTQQVPFGIMAVDMDSMDMENVPPSAYAANGKVRGVGQSEPVVDAPSSPSPSTTDAPALIQKTGIVLFQVFSSVWGAVSKPPGAWRSNRPGPTFELEFPHRFTTLTLHAPRSHYTDCFDLLNLD